MNLKIFTSTPSKPPFFTMLLVRLLMTSKRVGTGLSIIDLRIEGTALNGITSRRL